MKSRSLLFPMLVMGSLALIQAGADEMRVTEDGEVLQITRGAFPVLTYHKAEVPPPPGADPLFRRSGFIHPLCTPGGEAVTGVHPSDHFHHLGIWHAWVKTRHGEDEPDFWNLKGGTGRVRYAKTVSVEPVAAGGKPAGFTVEQEHIAYKGPDRVETVVLREQLRIAAEVVEGNNAVRYQVTQTNVSGQALELPAYRYGGCFAYRAPHSWDQSNSDYLTSEGLDRSNSHATRARWVAMSGPVESGPATLAVLIHPENHDFPQRLRTWPANTNHGAIFLNIAPTQEFGWEIKPGESIGMSYTLVVAPGKPDAAKIEAWWGRFTAAP